MMATKTCRLAIIFLRSFICLFVFVVRSYKSGMVSVYFHPEVSGLSCATPNHLVSKQFVEHLHSVDYNLFHAVLIRIQVTEWVISYLCKLYIVSLVVQIYLSKLFCGCCNVLCMFYWSVTCLCSLGVAMFSVCSTDQFTCLCSPVGAHANWLSTHSAHQDPDLQQHNSTKQG